MTTVFLLLRVTVKVDPRREGVTSELQLASSESGDTGAYHCQAKNTFGTDKQLVQLQVQGMRRDLRSPHANTNTYTVELCDICSHLT